MHNTSFGHKLCYQPFVFGKVQSRGVCPGFVDDERPPSEMNQFTHSFRLPHPEIYKAMLGTPGQSMPRRRLEFETDRAAKKRKTGHAFLQRVRSLVKPFQVQFIVNLG